MHGYRCYILDAEDHIVQAYNIQCGTDAEALSTAGGLLARDPYHHSVEVWEAARRVMKLDREAARHLLPLRPVPRPQQTLRPVA
jgi:hypothetical protein